LEKELALSAHDSLSEAAVAHRSPHRLACAALVRSLVWSHEDGALLNDMLASRLRVPNDFIFRLALSCCGLVEALPAYVVKDSWRRMEGSRTQAAVAPTRSSLRIENMQTPIRANDTLDESFMTAVSSLVDT
jgi:hypothetical protein